MSTAELATKIEKLSDTDEIETELIQSMKRSDMGFTKPAREVSQRMKKKYCYSEKHDLKVLFKDIEVIDNEWL